MTEVKRTTLPNGMVVLSEEIHDAPVVALQAWVHVGSADEAPDVAGVAHLHEHMLFKGTKRRGVGELARTVEASGGEINAWTSFDQTVYHVVMAAEELGTGVDVLADALQNSAFDKDELQRESEVVLEEIRRAQDSPARRVSNAVFSLAYQQHPYRRPVLGTEASVSGMTREQILGFFRTHYRPERVTFVAVGDFTAAALNAEIQKHFAGWQGQGAAPKKRVLVQEPKQEHVRVQILREDVKEARLAMAWHGPGMGHADLAAVDALAVILGHGDSSRLYESVRRRQPLVNDVFAYAYTPADPGLFMAGAGLRAENLRPALDALMHECYRLRENLVTPGELEKAKVLILSESAYQRETVQGQARKLGFFEVVGDDYAYEEAYMQALRALTPDDLRVAARRWLHAFPAVVLQVPADTQVTEADLQGPIAAAFKAAAPRSRAAPASPAGVTRITLNNGAVLLVRQENSPVVAMRAVAMGGQRWESSSTAGLCHLFTSVWGQATETLPHAALAERVALLGGSLSAFAGRNTEGLRGEFIADKGAEGLELFCQALLRPLLTEADMERERQLILERIRNRDDNAAAVAFDLFAHTLHPTHSYGQRFSGDEATVSRFTLNDLLAHRAQFLSPDKLVVSVVGGIGADRAIDALSAALDAEGGIALPAAPPPDPAPTAPRRAHRALDRKQSHVIVGALGATLYEPQRYALEVMCTILSGQSGRLFLDLRDNQSLAYSISSSNLEGLDPGHVLVHMGTSPDKVKQALAGVYKHLARLRDERVGDQELVRAQRYLIGNHAIDLQRCGARAMVMALNERYGLGYDDHLHYAEHIRAVSAAQLQELACQYLGASKLVEVIVGAAAA